jgi:hypothetical protein
MVLGQTPNIIADEPAPFIIEPFAPVTDFGPLQASQPTAIFSPGASFAINAMAIGGAILLAILVMRGLRK